MIKKINKINNFAIFDNFDWDSCVQAPNGQPLSFGKINILYGRNYSGKTTLSRILRILETHCLPEKYDSPQFEIILADGSKITETTITSAPVSVRVFNEDFVRVNLRFLIDDNSEIAPFAILGANNTEIEKIIKNLESEIGSNTEGQETGLYQQLKNDKLAAQKAKQSYVSANSELEKKLSDKATGRQNGIKYNADRFGDLNYTIAKIKQDIGIVVSQGYLNLSSAKKSEHENIIREQIKPPVRPVSIPELQIKIYSEKAAELLSRVIGSSNKIAELLHDIALNEWVKSGKTLLDGKNICAFCGNLIGEERWREINAHFDEESKKLEAEIDVLLRTINTEKKQLQTPIDIDKSVFYANFIGDVDIFINNITGSVQHYCSSLDSIINQLQARKTQITTAVKFNEPSDNSDMVKKLFENFQRTINENNEFSDKLSPAQKEAQKALRLQEVADFCSTIGYTVEEEKISTLKTKNDIAIKTSENTERLLMSKKQELQESLRLLNDEEEGARRVNKYLNDYFGHTFVTLEAEEVNEGGKRIRFRIMRNGKLAFNLSEGERSLISFCYFIAKLEDIDTYGVRPVIWIDDPISSLDSNHIYFMYSLIVSRIVQVGNFGQLFVSTHNLDFLKYLRRLVPSDGEKQCFLLEREGKSARIIKMPDYLKNKATEFNYLFHIIYKCSKCEVVTDENYDMLYNFGNNARKFLELFLYFKYPDNSEKLLPKLKRFLGTEEISPILMDRILNEESHGSSPEMASKTNIDPETIPVAKKLIAKLREDKEQYNAFLESIGEPV